MVAVTHDRSSDEAAPRQRWRFNVEHLVRALPIRWRILAIAGLNTAVVLILAGLLWNGATTLNLAWSELRQVRQSDELLTLLGSESGRLQNLIHRYINEPSPQIFAEILLVREAVLGTLKTRGSVDPILSPSVSQLTGLTVSEVMREAGFGVQVLPRGGLEDGINATRMLFPRMWFDREKCAPGLEALRHYQWAYNDRMDELKPTPVHNWASHGADALRGLAQAATMGRRSESTMALPPLDPMFKRNGWK